MSDHDPATMHRICGWCHHARAIATPIGQDQQWACQRFPPQWAHSGWHTPIVSSNNRCGEWVRRDAK